MRLAPVPMFYARDAIAAIEYSGESSKTTHGSTACIDACRYFGGLLFAAIHGATKETLLAPGYSPTGTPWTDKSLCPEIAEIAHGSFKRKAPPDIRGTGYVVQSLEAALWAFSASDDFRTGCLLAVNLGEDADTTGAIYGQMAGAFYGKCGISTPWLDLLAHRHAIETLAGNLAKPV